MRVLVLEDDALLAIDLAEMIAEMGHDVVGPCHAVRSALQKLDGAGCDVAILDYNLGEGTSEPVADSLIDRGISFTFLTGHSRGYLPEHLQAHPILEKPVTQARLAAALAALGSAGG